MTLLRWEAGLEDNSQWLYDVTAQLPEQSTEVVPTCSHPVMPGEKRWINW